VKQENSEVDRDMNMTMEEQILEFLDGNLSGADEEELLHRLAVSPERRALLRQHLQVREMVGILARKQKMTVPGALTAGVFASVASLGYSGPIPPAPSAQTAGLKPPVASPARTGMRKRTTALLALAFLLLGSGVTYLLGNRTEQAVTPTANQEFSTTSSVSNTTAPSNTASTSTQNTAASNTASTGQVIARQGTSHAHAAKNHSSNNSASNLNGAVVGYGDNSTPVQTKSEVINTPVADNVANAQNAKQLVNTPVNTPAPPAVQPTTEEKKDIREPNGGIQRPSNPLNAPEERKSYTQPYSFSVRSGGGKMPGSSYGYTGSLFELRGTYHLNNWLSMTGSYGQFMPYETGVVSAQIMTNDRTQQLKYSSDIQYKNVLGMELGARFAIEEIPFELEAGAMNDLQGTWIPRGSLFTSLDWSENLQLKVGIEGMFYTHKINFSNSQTQPSFLLGTARKQETAGFVGPALELLWKF
jgi:cytoskeletal protein RodZ